MKATHTISNKEPRKELRGKKVKYLYNRSGTPKVQALTKEEGQSKKEWWVEEDYLIKKT